MTKAFDFADLAAPELDHLRLGFMPLTDCAPLVVAEMLGLGKKYGLTIVLKRQASWAALRDKLLYGEIDAAHVLYGLAYGVQLGLGGPQADMSVLMTLNRNGQAISVSRQVADAVECGTPLCRLSEVLGRKPIFAQTFPTGTHAMWLNYWLASQNVHPLRDVENVVLPPPQMAAAMQAGEIDGFCCGEPWHTVAASKGIGSMAVASGEIWPDHPEKALGCRRDFAFRYPNTAKALIRTLLEACRWLEEPDNRLQAVVWLASGPYLDLDRELVLPSMIANGAAPLRFFDADGMNAPLPGDGLWFLSQFRRWGLMRRDVDWNAVAADVSASALFASAAEHLSKVPTGYPSITLSDGAIWNGVDLKTYADRFTISAIRSGHQSS